MTSGVLLLLGGIALAGLGGELFVRGLVGVARWTRVAPGIVALTLAAFATSSPELSVSVMAALEGRPQIGLGDALGSNVVNLALIFGLSLLAAGVRAPRGTLRRDFPVALLVPALTGLLIIDGTLSRLDGAVMLALFLVWLGACLFEAGRQRSAAEAVLAERNRTLIVVSVAAGLAMLVGAGRLIVVGGTEVGLALGLDIFVVGAVIVAIGTSVPELATTLIAQWRGHAEVGLGTVLGSNIFNGFFILPLVALIHPLAVEWQEIVAALGFGLVVVALSFPRRSGLIERRRGVLLLALYAAYVVTLLQLGIGA
jgi:cation:H+ antiporter